MNVSDQTTGLPQLSLKRKIDFSASPKEMVINLCAVFAYLKFLGFLEIPCLSPSPRSLVQRNLQCDQQDTDMLTETEQECSQSSENLLCGWESEGTSLIFKQKQFGEPYLRMQQMRGSSRCKSNAPFFLNLLLV